MNSVETTDQALKDRVISGVKWLITGKFSGQLINWALTFFVMRILAPADYGLMAMASMFVTVFTLVNEMGMGAAIIQAPVISTDFIRRIFGMTLVINFGLALLMFLAAPVIAAFFDESRLGPIVRFLSCQFIISAFMIVPQSILDRELSFKHKSLIDLSANLVGGVCSLVLALTGYGIWALVWANPIIMGLRTIGYNVLTSFRHLPSFRFSGMKDILFFGGQITLEKILWYAYSQADTLIIGKFLGKEVLGFYSVGKHVASLPADKIMPIVNQIVFPAFSRIQHDLEQVGSHALKAMELISFFAFPVFWGISCVAPELVSLVLGDKWMPAALPLMFISIMFPVRMINSVLVSILKSLKRTDLSLTNQLVYLGVMAPAFLLASRHGIVGVSLVWPLVSPFCFVMVVVRSARIIGVSPVQIFMTMGKSLLFSGLMYAAVMGAKLLPGMKIVSTSITLSLLVLVGAALYTGCQWVFCRSDIRSMMQWVRR